MRTAATALVTLAAMVASASPAHAALAYDDPWLEGDLQQMRVPDALDILARTPRHVIVADVDSGARLNDPDLAGHLMAMSTPYTCTDEYGPGPSYAASPADGDFGCDFIGTGSEATPSTIPDGDPTDPYGHGTATAAIIAAVPNNGIEGAGVAPNARVLPIRACYGGNPDCYDETATAGLRYAVAMGATVVNASWPPVNDYSTAFRDVIHDDANVLFVFAIGGSDQNAAPYTLCTDKTTYPNVVCVGLAKADDAVGTDDADQTTDVSAPGYAGVPSATGARTEAAYTSGAAAHVSGAAAILRGIAPDLTAAQIRGALVGTSRQVAGYATANRAGGIVDVAAAVRSVQATDGLVTPAEGHGAAADSPNPFTGEAAPPAGAGGTLTGPTPAAPVAPAAPAAPTVTRPGAKLTSPALSLVRLPTSVRAGHTLTLRVRVTDGTGTVSATVTHARATLAHARGRVSKGAATLKLRFSRHVRTGRARLTVRLTGAKTVIRSITVARRR